MLLVCPSLTNNANSFSLSPTFSLFITSLCIQNRDRLELYALHKQAVSGDAPPQTSNDETLSVADRTKIVAWRTKQGMTKSEAMTRYVEECDRQQQVYGTMADGDGGGSLLSNGSSTSSPVPATTITKTTVARTNGGEATGSSGGSNEAAAAADYVSGGGGGLLCPRGLAAVPLLCAAASESRSAYLARLQLTHSSNGVSAVRTSNYSNCLVCVNELAHSYFSTHNSPSPSFSNYYH